MPRAAEYRLRVHLSIEKWQNIGSSFGPTQERLSIEEEINLGALDFMGTMGVLGQLHEAVTAIRPQASTPERST